MNQKSKILSNQMIVCDNLGSIRYQNVIFRNNNLCLSQSVLLMQIMILHTNSMVLLRIIFLLAFNDLQNGFHTNHTNWPNLCVHNCFLGKGSVLLTELHKQHDYQN